MKSYKHLSIRQKLNYIIFGVTLLSLGVGFSIVIFAEIRQKKRDMITENIMHANIVGEYLISPLVFQDTSVAENVLVKLQIIPSIQNGRVFNEKGETFAAFGITGKTVVPPLPDNWEAAEFNGDYLHVFQPILYQDERYGAIYLRVSTAELDQKIRNQLLLFGLLLIVLITCSYFLANRLQRIISHPILKLAETIREISGKGDYSVRVGKKGADEIGVLYDGFNDMLEQIQIRQDARDKAEEQIKRYNEELQRSNQELEQFAYVASHDLQEPLRMISSYTQMIERRYADKLDQDAKDFIKFAVDGANRMQRLINDLLSYSRVTTRGKPFEIVDSYSILGQAVSNLHQSIAEAGAIVTNDDLPAIRTDESQLVRIFQNLIDNALKFRGEEAPRIHVSAKGKGDEWFFSVRDNGIGIDKKFQERVFTIFQRLHAKEEYPGTGIGLAICKRIVQRHGGRIWFESGPDKGTTFYFTIPKTSRPL